LRLEREAEIQKIEAQKAEAQKVADEQRRLQEEYQMR
jgi:hypothetical protein